MYESEILSIQTGGRYLCNVRPPPAVRAMAHISHDKNNCGHGSQNQIKTTKSKTKNETIEIIISTDCPVPYVRHGQGKRPMDGHRPVQHRPKHRKLFKVTRSGIADSNPHGQVVSGNGENLPTGEEVLRRSPVGQQPRP